MLTFEHLLLMATMFFTLVVIVALVLAVCWMFLQRRDLNATIDAHNELAPSVDELGQAVGKEINGLAQALDEAGIPRRPIGFMADAVSYAELPPAQDEDDLDEEWEE